MEIEVEFFAYLVDYSPTGGRRVTLSLEEGTTLNELWAKLRIPPKTEKIWLVNGVYCFEEKRLHQGDAVSIYPMLDGG
jgi:molybdopterin converting factor small subunit